MNKIEKIREIKNWLDDFSGNILLLDFLLINGISFNESERGKERINSILRKATEDLPNFMIEKALTRIQR